MESIRMKAARAALALALCLGCALGAAAANAAAPGEALAAQQAGWVKSGPRWWYAQPGGGYARGWLKVGPSWYWFDSSGWMVTGWQKVGSSWYWLDSSGVMRTGWLQQGAKWYYLKASGAMATGWQKVGSSWYWFDSSGVMRTGWLQQGAKWYYLKASGAMATGWQKVGSSWYWFDASGVMASSRWVGDYYLGASGAMATSQWVGAYYVGADGKWVPGYGQAPVTPASDFEYTIGDFELDGEIGTGSLLQAIEQKPGYCGEVVRYGNYYEGNYGSVDSDEGNYATDGSGDSYANGGSGGNILGFDCGHGVYITGYKGSSSTIVLPEKIDGVDVVYADLWDLDAPDSQVIDASRCSSLRTLQVLEPCSVNFGSIREIQSLYFQSGYFLSDLDMTSLDNLAFLHFQGETPGNFRFGSVDNLEYFAGMGLHSLNLSQAANLRMLCSYGGSLSSTSLDISGCKSLETIKLASNEFTSFNAENFPKLSLLDLSGNPLTSNSLTQLEAWASQGDRDFFYSE